MTKTMWMSMLILAVVKLSASVTDRLFLEQTYEFSTGHFAIGLLVDLGSIFIGVYMLNVVKERNHGLFIQRTEKCSLFGFARFFGFPRSLVFQGMYFLKKRN